MGYRLDPPCLFHSVLSWVIVQTLLVYLIVCIHGLLSRPSMFISQCNFMGYCIDPPCLSHNMHSWVIVQTLHVYLIICFHGLLSRPSMFISQCAFMGYCLDPSCLFHSVLSWVIGSHHTACNVLSITCQTSNQYSSFPSGIVCSCCISLNFYISRDHYSPR